MSQAVLIVEQDDVRRAQLRAAFGGRGLRVYEVADAVDAMVALGRADFGVLLASEGRRHLSLRGLCLLARRRHPGIALILTADGDADEAAWQARVGIEVSVLPAALSARDVVDAVVLLAPSLLSPFDAPAPTEVISGPVYGAEEPRTDSGHIAVTPTREIRRAPSATASDPYLLVSETHGGPDSDVDDFGEPTLLDQETELEVPSLDDVAPADAAGNDDYPPAVTGDIDLADATVVDVRSVALDLSLGSAEPPQSVSLAALQPPGPAHGVGFVEPADTHPNEGGSSTREHVLFEGDVEDDGNAPLLMGVFAQELTGRLELDAPGGQIGIYFHAGEPVGAAHPDGDAGLFRALTQTGPSGLSGQRPAAPEGELMSALVADGSLTGHRLHELLRSVLESRLAALLSTSSGTYRFLEDHGFLQTLPLCRVDPFAMVRRHCAQRTGARLTAESRRLSRAWVIARQPLAVCAPRMGPLPGGVDLAAAIGDGAEVSSLIAALGQGEREGALWVLALAAGRLVELRDLPPERVTAPPSVRLDTAPTVEVARIPDADDSRERSAEQEALREEIFALYMRLKPLTRPAQVLGISLSAPREEVDAAFHRRMSVLDYGRVASFGSAGDLLRSRIDELRAKVTRAYEAVVLQLEITGRNPPAQRGPKRGTNPW